MSSVNPAFTLDHFKELYPQFAGEGVPNAVLELYLELAHQTIKETRWHSYWKLAMGLFVAHFATLWAMGAASAAGSAADIAKSGENQGLISSKSAGGVSITKDFSLVAGGQADWGAWNQTRYGSQLVALAKLVGKGGMQIW